MSIDWEYRAKQELWTIHESACLLAGVDPRQDKAGAKAQVLHAHAGSPQGMLYRELKDAVVAGSIAFAPMGEWIGNHRIRPMDAVKWAINRGHTVPQDLQRLAIVQTQERLDISTRERDTLLKLIICMAIKGYEYEPGAKKSPVTAQICEHLKSLDIPLDADTVKAKLKDGVALLPVSDTNPWAQLIEPARSHSSTKPKSRTPKPNSGRK